MTIEKFACHLCSKQVDKRGKLNKHLKTHTKPYNCQTCTRGFASRLDLQRHIRSQHRAGNKQYRCHVEGCVFTSNRKDNLRRHQMRTHGSKVLDHSAESSNQKQPPYQQSDVSGIAELNDTSNFMRVAASGDLNRLEAFLSAGLPIDTKADDHSTALHCAARAGQVDVVKYLLVGGASVSERNQNRRLPIHEAVLSKTPETFKCFLDRMTPEEFRTSRKHLDSYLVRSGSVEIVDVYLTRLGNDFTNQDNSKKLSFAVRMGHDLLVAALLDDPEVDGNQRIVNHKKGFRQIHLAAYYGRTKVMEILIACNRVNKTLETYDSRQALHIAASQGSAAIVKQLIQHPSVDVNCQDRDAETPLHYASSKGHTMVVQQLTSHPSVDVNCQNRDAATPLHYAASNGHRETASLLLRLSDSIRDGHRISSKELPTSLAFTKEDFLHRLLKHPDFGGPNKILPGRYKTILNVAVRENDCEVIEFLVACQDVDVNMGDKYGWSPLLNAARDGKLEAVRLLLQHKDIDVNQFIPGLSWTALDYAKVHKHNEIVDLLLSHGAMDYDICGNLWPSVPTITHIENSQSTTLQPDHGVYFDPSDDGMSEAPTKAWEESFDMEEGMME
ncbi:ankyrin repeat-containing domain protein [Alternaria rosae]|uniref:ankyrin repeat-containing domain protein n=1 Tax=Alternaria rosae TaxID=1187941 RepID=UPI001E8E7932|nr:ankyrin repeat-containing domain protein [Alternaria rosae]KAH6868114.1 ankyrin repeat-containing domain protein [Alternaria rosae]